MPVQLPPGVMHKSVEALPSCRVRVYPAVSLVLIVTASVFTVCLVPEAEDALILTVPEVVKAVMLAVTTLEIVVLAVSALARDDAKIGAAINPAVARPNKRRLVSFTNSP